MQPGNISSASGRIQEALEELQIAWSATSDHWRDSSSENIAENRLKPIEHEVRAALPAISQLVQVLQQARRELEE